ncbi:MAG: ComF family protein [Chlorobiaceae bacterium]|nr:ComF family protein [Chlorobiaceae bacterium]
MIEGLGHILFPKVCIVCRKLLEQGEEQICSGCFSQFNQFPGADAGGNALRSTILKHFGLQAVPADAWCLYPFHRNGKLHEAMHGLKYEGLFPLGSLFGRRLGELIKSSGRRVEFDAIVPLPLHSLKRIERSYNQSEKIAEGISGVLGSPVSTRCIERSSYTGSQTGLTLTARRKNMAGAFRAGRQPCRGRVLLVDDVLTTGATMVAAAGALLASGAESVAFAVVGFTEKE